MCLFSVVFSPLLLRFYCNVRKYLTALLIKQLNDQMMGFSVFIIVVVVVWMEYNIFEYDETNLS